MKNPESSDPIQDFAKVPDENMSAPEDDGEEINEADIVPLRDSPEMYREKAAMLEDLWNWAEDEVYYINTLKGWTRLERKDGEMLALLHSEVSEVLEAMRAGNNPSARIPEISEAEEEMADILIRLMDYAKSKKWNLIKAFFLKLEFNKTRPYRHGGKLF